MAYTDYDKMKLAHPEKVFIELTDDLDTGVVDMTKIAGCIEAADSEIDGYIPEDLELPLDPVPRIVIRISTVISTYNCYARYAGSMPETQQTQYDNVIKLLEKIQTRKIRLRYEDTATPVADAAPARRFRASARPQIFTDDVLNRFS